MALENPFNAKSPPKRTRDACDLAEELHTEPSKRQRLTESAERSDSSPVNGNATVKDNSAAESGANIVVSARVAKSAEIRALRRANGDWPYLRSSSTFANFSLLEQSQTLKTWMSDMEGYVEKIQAGAVPAAKVLDFFGHVNAHLNAVTETLDDIALTNQRLGMHQVKARERLRKAELERQEVDELLGRFALPSTE